MRWYRKECPSATVLLFCAVAVVAGAAGFVEGHKRGNATLTCPRLMDSRPLVAYNLDTKRCHYSPIPRPALDLTPTELRRMATMRERMEKTR
jgi:hypothetical protein